ncbi:MAG TPA: enoyl-CoA hydratase-related protein [Candidatus Thermoplasmatota archaeon]|nr:enoyl-CoA hydratase-related protein [Candidatus Thermoplasmatota archaeon]
MATYSNLVVERDGPLGTITINRPKALNALNSETLSELVQAVHELDLDAHVQVICVTGAGEKSFVAGADISEMANMGAIAATEHARRGQEAVSTLENARKPTIAAVNGFALGGGLELALACDLRIASENAVVGLPEVTLAVIPGFGGTQRLARIVGEGRAKELVFTGRKVKADEAFQMGLVNKVVPLANLKTEIKALAESIAANGPVAVRTAKRVIRAGLDADLTTGLAIEREAFGGCFATEDQKEGMKAFLEKRKAGFKGQ